MKSIKPGRGPSAFGAAGGVFAALFGVFWTVMAASMGAPGVFVFFGIMFIVMAIAGVAYNYNNATRKNRMSLYDITEENEEPDPLQEHFAGEGSDEMQQDKTHQVNDPEGFSYDTRGFDKLSYGIDDNRQTQKVMEKPDCNTDASSRVNFCPYCRYQIKGDFVYCPKCGKDISQA